MKKFLLRFRGEWLDLLSHIKTRKPLVVGVAVVMAIYALSKLSDGSAQQKVIIEKRPVDFERGRVLGSPGKSLYEGKERKFAKTTKDIMRNQEQLQQSIKELEEKLRGFQDSSISRENERMEEEAKARQPESEVPETSLPEGKLHPAPSGVLPGAFNAADSHNPYQRRPRINEGPSILSFPVKTNFVKTTEGVTIPSGSYVKAKLMTGVEAGRKAIPALLQLDFTCVAPNDYRVDLTGCFALAKSQGDLSTERVQMQIYKISCVSKRGKMFEREVNGFVADDKDNSFAVPGSVNGKQDRVAGMAFLSSVVEGNLPHNSVKKLFSGSNLNVPDAVIHEWKRNRSLLKKALRKSLKIWLRHQGELKKFKSL